MDIKSENLRIVVWRTGESSNFGQIFISVVYILFAGW